MTNNELIEISKLSIEEIEKKVDEMTEDELLALAVVTVIEERNEIFECSKIGDLMWESMKSFTEKYLPKEEEITHLLKECVIMDENEELNIKFLENDLFYVTFEFKTHPRQHYIKMKMFVHGGNVLVESKTQGIKELELSNIVADLLLKKVENEVRKNKFWNERIETGLLLFKHEKKF